MEGLVARERTKERNSFKKRKSRFKPRSKNYKCHYYHKLRHFHRDCPNLNEKKGKEVVGIAENSSNGFENVLTIFYCGMCTDEE